MNAHFPQTGTKARGIIEITTLSHIPGQRIEKYLGNLNFFFIRETTSIKEVYDVFLFQKVFVIITLKLCRWADPRVLCIVLSWKSQQFYEATYLLLEGTPSSLTLWQNCLSFTTHIKIRYDNVDAREVSWKVKFKLGDVNYLGFNCIFRDNVS